MGRICAKIIGREGDGMEEENKSFTENRKKKKFQIGLSVLFFVMLIGTLGGYYSIIKEASIQKKKVITINTNEHEINYIKQGDCVSQTFVLSGAELAAVYIKFYISKPNEKGIIHATLLENGTEIESWDKPVAVLKKEKYEEFALRQPITDTEGKSYCIELEAKGLQNDTNLAFYSCNFSRIQNSEFQSYFNGQEQEKDIIFEVASTEKVYNFFQTGYLICAGLVIIFFVILYILIMKKIEWEKILIIGVFGIGVLYSIVFTPYSAPDEPKHFATAYHLSNLMMFDKEDMKDGYVYMRKSDAEAEWTLCPDANTYLFATDHMTSTVENEKVLYTGGQVLNVKNIYMYIPSALGISIGRILHLNTVWTVELGRIFSLVFFCIALWCTIKITPVGKNIFACIAFFPMVLEQITSYSYDAFIISGYFLYIAYMLRLIYGEEKIEKKQIAILGVLTLIMAPCKAIYVCAAGMVLLLVKKVSKKKFILLLGTVFVAIVISNMWANWNTVKNLLGINQPVVVQDVEVETQQETVQQSEEEQVPQYYALSDFTNNPKELIMIFVRTAKTSLFSYGVTMVGYRLGWLEIPVSIIIVMLFIVIAIMSASTVSDKENMVKVHGLHRILYICICCGVGILAMLSMLTCWTPKGSEVIQGVQGRYFLPVAVLIFFVFKSNRFKLSSKWNGACILLLYCLNVVALLQVLCTTMFR